MDHHDPTRSQDRLRARITSGGRCLFTHVTADPGIKRYRVPDSCRGYTIPAEFIEKAVIRGVRAMLEDDAALHRAIALGRTGREPIADGGIFTGDERTRLTQEASRLEQYRDNLWRRHFDQVRRGDPVDRAFLETELEKVNHEIEAIRRQLTVDQQLRRRPRQPESTPDTLAALLTDDPPDDAEHRLRRWAIVNELVSQVIVHDTDDGLSVELFGPLVPDTDDAASWQPGPAAASADERVRTRLPLPEVPEPFRDHSKPERLVTAYRWRLGASGDFPTEVLSPASFLAAIRASARAHPTGPLFGEDGVGRQRWREIAVQRRLPLCPNKVRAALNAAGGSPDALVREAVGRRAALLCGRVRTVTCRDEVVWILAQALSDGYSFGRGYLHAPPNATRPVYPLSATGIRAWSDKYAMGNVEVLAEEARRLLISDGGAYAGDDRHLRRLIRLKMRGAGFSPTDDVEFARVRVSGLGAGDWGCNPASMAVTSRRTAALEGGLLAAVRACRQ